MDVYLLVCPCGQKMKVPGSYLGKTGTCVRCKRKLPITEKNTRKLTPAPEAAPAGAHEADARKLRIGERLIEAGLVSEDQVAEALRVQQESGGKTVEILVSLGYIDVKTFCDFLAKQPGIASIDLSSYEIERDLVVLVPKEFALAHEVFPIDKLGNLLTVGMACPLDDDTIGELEDLTKLRVKALLCALDDIRNVIERYYGGKEAEAAASAGPVEPAVSKAIEGALKLENLAVVIREIGALPALPETIQRVQAIMEDPEVSINDVVDVVRTDPPVAAKILSVANSAAYGLPNRVDSVGLAATLLGLHETYMLVLSSAVVNTFEKGPQFDYRRFWTESMRTAQAATELAKLCGFKRNSGVFAAGLLHDIGRIALWESVPQRYAQVSNDLCGKALVEAEQNEIGLAHPEAGFELATNWGLPVEIAEPIRFHHAFEFAKKAREITAIVNVAWALTEMPGNGEIDVDAFVAECQDSLAFLGLAADAALAVRGRVALEEMGGEE